MVVKLKSQAEQNAEDVADSIDDILSGKNIEDQKRKTLKMPSKGTFDSVIRQAQDKIDMNQPRGKFGVRRHQRHDTEEKT